MSKNLEKENASWPIEIVKARDAEASIGHWQEEHNSGNRMTLQRQGVEIWQSISKRGGEGEFEEDTRVSDPVG